MNTLAVGGTAKIFGATLVGISASVGVKVLFTTALVITVLGLGASGCVKPRTSSLR